MPKVVVVNEAVGELRRQPDHTAEQVSQATMATPLRVLGSRQEGEWFRVESPDGYRGWIRSWSVEPFSYAALTEYEAGPRVEVDALVARVRSQATGRSDAIREATVGVRLPRLGRKGSWIRVLLPDHERGWIHARDLLVDKASLRRRRRPSHVPALLRTAVRLLGAPYQWGGVTPKGLDCSGLVQTVYGLHGVGLPRDAQDQLRWVRSESYLYREPGSIQPGHLVFFGPTARRMTHVGIGLPDGRFLHASGRVRIDSLRAEDADFNRRLFRLFRAGGPVPMA